jgi:hypothetical protein
MPSDDLEPLLNKRRSEAEVNARQIALSAFIASIPYAGGSIMEILHGRAQQRTEKRLNDVFEAMKSNIDALGADKIDRHFLESEEFQTILFLVLEKLHTTHDDEKLKAFGAALANATSSEFSNDDKELYIAVLRDLNVGDLRILNDDRLKGWSPHINAMSYGGEVLSRLYRLQGMGLVTESIHAGPARIGGMVRSREDAQRRLTQAVNQSPRKSYHLSEFGARFLTFIAAAQVSARARAAKAERGIS